MRTRSASSLSRLFPLLCVAFPGVAAAQEVSPADHEQAVTNFQAGRRFVEQNNCKEAIPRFLESLRHESSVGARFNLAECSRAVKENANAWNQFKQAQQAAIQKGDNERKEAAGKNIGELDAAVVKLRMTLPDGLADLRVKIDGHEVLSIDHELLKTGYAVEPGLPHRIDVTATNRAPWTTPAPLKGAPGQELPVIMVDLGAPLVAEGTGVGDGQRRTGLIVGGVGAVGVVVGTVFGILAIGAKSDAKAACEAGGGSYPKSCAAGTEGAVDPKNSTAKSDATISTIGFIAGGVLLAGGAVLYFTAPKPYGKEAARLHLAPAIGPGTAGAFLGGSF